jgi:PHP family Zn ribbon phosphoesterase
MVDKNGHLNAKELEHKRCLSASQSTECKCPKCGHEFKKRINYKGKLPAKVYCERCQRAIKRF